MAGIVRSSNTVDFFNNLLLKFLRFRFPKTNRLIVKIISYFEISHVDSSSN